MSAEGSARRDRALGVLLGQACGDALGVPYEFARPPGPGELAEMSGGGLGGFAPGEWSDDTAMAVAVADGLALLRAAGLDAALDEIASGFLRWYDDGPPDVGVQTSSVLSATRARVGPGEAGVAVVMRQEAAAYAARHPRSAGNGALMRTSPVALVHLRDREACAATARAVAELTHADPLAGDSCVLWSEAIRVAVGEARLDVRAGLDLLPEGSREQWSTWIDEGETGPVGRLRPNGFTVTALQAAVHAISATPVPEEAPEQGRFACRHLQDALHASVRIGDDTDTVAAIAGGLLGARWGASAVPWRWRRAVHGWPGRGGRELVSAGYLAYYGREHDRQGWPSQAVVDYDEEAGSSVVPHPRDAGVLLGTHRARGHGATAAVALCRVGPEQPCFEGAELVVESGLLDEDDPVANSHLGFALWDAADAVRGLRAEGHTVLLHCVAAHQRTPSVAVAYSRLLGVPGDVAQREIIQVLASARGHGALWDAAASVNDSEVAS